MQKWEEHHERANVLTDKNDITLKNKGESVLCL